MTSRWAAPFNPRNPRLSVSVVFVAAMFRPPSPKPQTASLATISMAQTGRAMTLFNVQRQAGQAMGVAALATVLAVTRPVPPDLGGYHLAFAVAAPARP